MITDIVASGIIDLDGFLFDAAGRCPCCGGELKSHDIKHRVFARINTGIMNADMRLFADVRALKKAGGRGSDGKDGVGAGCAGSTGHGAGGDDGNGGAGSCSRERNITVNVKRWYCTDCGKLVYSKSPFYEGIRTGAPIVDFCIVNRDLHPPNHIAKILGKLGIIVTPATVRNIQQSEISKGATPENIPAVNIYGIMFPSSLLNLSEMTRRGK